MTTNICPLNRTICILPYCGWGGGLFGPVLFLTGLLKRCSYHKKLLSLSLDIFWYSTGLAGRKKVYGIMDHFLLLTGST